MLDTIKSITARPGYICCFPWDQQPRFPPVADDDDDSPWQGGSAGCGVSHRRGRDRDRTLSLSVARPAGITTGCGVTSCERDRTQSGVGVWWRYKSGIFVSLRGDSRSLVFRLVSLRFGHWAIMTRSQPTSVASTTSG